MKKYCCFIFLTISLVSHSLSNDPCVKFILNEQFSKVKKCSSNIKDKNQRELYLKIADSKATYQDYNDFLQYINLYGRIEYKKLDAFFRKRIAYPGSRNEVDLSFVKLKFIHINLLRDEIGLKEASEENNKLLAYLISIKHQETKAYRKAIFYVGIHNLMMKIIHFKYQEAEEDCYKLTKEALALQDDDLIIIAKFHSLFILMNKKDLDRYIQTCKEIFEIEKKNGKLSFMHENVVGSYLDASIFKGEYDEAEIENLLLGLYSNPRTKYTTLSYIAKYVGSQAKNSPAQQRIFQFFQVKNLPDFCDKIYKEGRTKINGLERYYLLNECANALHQNQYYDLGIKFKDYAIHEIKLTYGEDLSESIAQHETIEIEKEKNFQIEKEKEKQKIYIIITVLVAFFLVLAIFLIVKFRKNSKILKLRNAEKEMLLKEIHHRVKNNFQTISSLLELQSKDIEDERALGRLNEGQSRIKSMSLIHQKLYQHENLATVNFQEYSEQLIREILMSYDCLDTKVTVTTGNLQLDIDTAIPLGLILNELCTNSCKYAFKKTEDPELNLEIKAAESESYVLIYRDNGPGLPENQNLKDLKSLGLRLVQRLTKQLHGSFTFHHVHGACFEITFKDTQKRKEVN